MGLLDSYNQFVTQKCDELTKQNSTFEKLTETFGLTNLLSGVQSFFEGDIVENLKNSPLRALGEDVLAQAITDNARRLSQNVLNQVPSTLTSTLKDLRTTAFNTVLTTMTFKNDMVLYFASVTAQECVDAIKDKRKNLIALQESVRQLHNALLTLAGSTPFYSQYLQDLREALLKIDKAENEVFIVQSVFFSTLRFPANRYENAKALLEEAHQLIMPPVTGSDAEELNQGFLKGVLQAPEFGTQLAMLMNIPKMTFNMLKQYDLYALKVLKVNALIFGFQSIVQNLEAVTGGGFKDIVIEQLISSRNYLKDLISDMSIQLNGEENLVTGPIAGFTNNPTKTSAKAVSWGVRVKAAQVMLELLDPASLQKLDISNKALNAYYKALEDLAKLDDRVSPTAILRATDSKEQPGQIEPDFITFAFQANQAILDTSRLTGTDGKLNTQSVLATGAKLNSTIQLAIDQDRDIETILLTYIKTVEPIIKSIKALGDSVFKLLDGLGMDRASDFLKKGAFGDFFAMNGRTSTYVGAAIAGLSGVQAVLSSTAQRECVGAAITEIKVEETSKNLIAQRSVQQNFPKLQRTNEKKCADRKRMKRKVDGCASGLDPALLRDNPLKALSSAFGGIFGLDVADSLESTSQSYKGAAFTSSNKGIANLNIGNQDASGVYTSVTSSALAAQDAVKAAGNADKIAKDKLVGAINGSDGYEADSSESMDSLTKKAASAESTNGDEDGAFDEARVSREISEDTNKDAFDLVNNVDNVYDVFGDAPASANLFPLGN